jgi:chromosomal replication initiator protein
MVKRTNWDEKKTQIRGIISGYFGVDFLVKTRKREVCYPRQIYMNCLRKFTRMSLTEIGQEAGFADHSTPSHSIKLLKNLSKYDEKVKRQLMEIESMIQ